MKKLILILLCVWFTGCASAGNSNKSTGEEIFDLVIFTAELLSDLEQIKK